MLELLEMAKQNSSGFYLLTSRYTTEKVVILLSSNVTKIYNSHTIDVCIFMLLQGTTIQATSFNENIDIFGTILNIDSSYTISNASVKHVQPQFKVAQHDFELIFNSKTKILHVPDHVTPLTQEHHEFVPLSDISKHVETDTRFGMQLRLKLHLRCFKILYNHNSFSLQILHLRYTGDSP